MLGRVTPLGNQDRIKLHESGGDVRSPRVIGECTDEVAAATGTHADDADRPGLRLVEHVVDSTPDNGETSTQWCRRIFIGLMPSLPMLVIDHVAKVLAVRWAVPTAPVEYATDCEWRSNTASPAVDSPATAPGSLSDALLTRASN